MLGSFTSQRMASRWRVLLALCCVAAFGLPVRLSAAYTPRSFLAHTQYSPNTSLPNALPMYYVSKAALDRANGYTVTAQEVFDMLRTRKAGQRVVDLQGLAWWIGHDAGGAAGYYDNYAWFKADNLSMVTSYVTGFLAAYQAIDSGNIAPIDAIVTDYEGGFSNWHLGGGATNYYKYESIAADSRYATDIEPRLDAYGFQSDGNGELYYACYWGQGGLPYAQNYLRWNAVNGERVNACLDQVFWEPAKQYYPDIKFFNYGGAHYNTTYGFCDFNGHRSELFGGGDYAHAGSGPSWSFYGSLGNVKLYSPLGPNDPPRPYPGTPFNALRFTVNRARASRLTAMADPLWPWLAYRNFGEGSYFTNNDYYQEMVLHTGLTLPGGSPFLYWAPYGPGTGNDQDTNLLSNLFTELDELVGFADRTWVSDLAAPEYIRNWSDPFYLTGMTANGRIVWRLTPDLSLSGVTRGDCKIADAPPTFAIGTCQITFPANSTILTPTAEAAPVGYWISSPAGTTPTVSTITQVATPTMSPGSGTWTTAQAVTLACATGGATIRYTTDGSTPTASSPAYTSALNISSTTTLKAKAFAANMSCSATAVGQYQITTSPLANFFTASYTGVRNNYNGVLGFEFTPNQDLTITALGRQISTAMLQNHTVTIYRVSDQVNVASATVTPTSPVDTLGYAYALLPSAVTLTNGTAYRICSQEYSGGDAWRDIGTIGSHLATATISRGVYSGGGYPSATSGAANQGFVPPTFYTGAPGTVAAPSCSPDGSTAGSPVSVTISCATGGAIIRYTTTGADPTEDSPVYAGALSLAGSVTLKARAYKAGLLPSAIATAVFDAQTTLTNFLRAPYNSSWANEKNDRTGNLGYQFVAQAPITVYALGRAVIGGAMNSSHAIKLWRVSDQALLASATVSAGSATDRLGYKYALLGTPVALTKGESYRITSYETNGGDKYITYWVSGSNFYLNSHSPAGTISGAVSSPSGQDVYPNGTDFGVAERAYGTATFYFAASNAAPSVTLNTPTDDQVFLNAPATVQLAATAADNDGTIATVRFYRDGPTLIGTGTYNAGSGRYEYAWTNVAVGTYNITVEATDNSGALVASAPVHIRVNDGPTVTLTAPSGGTVYSPAPATIDMTATAADGDGSIDRVEFYAGANKVGEDSTAPYACTWSNVSAGTYQLTAKAIDTDTQSTTSAAAQVRVNASPTITLTGPGDDTHFLVNDAVKLTATASDSDGTIDKVEFYVDGGKVGEDSTAPYECTWTMAGLSAHTIYARAIDNDTAATNSASVTATGIAAGLGLTGLYYAGYTLNTVKYAAIDGPISFNWYYSGHPFGLARPYSQQWTGYVLPRYTETYTIYGYADDGCIITVNGQELVNDWSYNGNMEESGTIALNAGQLYTIRIQSHDAGGGTFTYLSWSSASQAKEYIPASRLFPDNQLPTASITAPAHGSLFSAPVNVTITASASDSDGTIAKVEFYDGATCLGEDTSAPYSYTWNNVPVGAHALTAVSYDDDNAPTHSTVVHITVQ